MAQFSLYESENRRFIEIKLILSYLVLDVMTELRSRKIRIINSVHWMKQLRYYNEEQITSVRILRTKLMYGYEYLGDLNRIIMTPQTDRYYR